MNKKIEELREKLEKEIGKGVIMFGKDKPNIEYVSYSTGSISADKALGVGGFPKGRIIEIFGDYSTGKTLLALNAIVDCQSKGGVAAFVDMENAIDLKWAEKLGVNTEELILAQPNSGEECIKVIEGLLDSGYIDLIIIDSVAAMLPQSEIEADPGSAVMGGHARLMGQTMRKLSPKVNKSNTCTIWLNQTRLNIGNPYEPVVQPGGRALRFFADIRISLSMGTKYRDKDNDQGISNEINGKIIKNKCSVPFTTFNYTVTYGIGIDKLIEILDIAIEKEIIKKGGAWLSYGELKVQGLEKFKQMLIDNPELRLEIEQKIK